MKTTRLVQTVLMLLLATGLVWAQKPVNSPNIVDVAAAEGSFNTMVSFLRLSGMTTVLNGTGPYTLFAPTDAAFAKLPPDVHRKLIENKLLLPMFLNHFIVPGRLTSAEILQQPEVRTFDGRKLPFDTKGGTVLVNHARIIKPDIVTNNGVIHGIDSVDMGVIGEFLQEVEKHKAQAQE